jgi:hypothetical protein
MYKQAIERKHHVGRRTIVKALASANRPRGRRSTASPPRWKACMHRYIDAMITANLTITIVTIWELLTDRGLPRSAVRGRPGPRPDPPQERWSWVASRPSAISRLR